METAVVYSPESEVDRGIFEMMLLEAATDSTPTQIGDVTYNPEAFERYCAEGRMRAEANARMRGGRWRPQDQATPGCELTVDELGRVAEGAVEAMLGLDVAAVLADGVDARPDKTIAGVRFDVKGAHPRPGDSFAVPTRKVHEYDALVLVQHIEPGRARVWCCKSAPGDSRRWGFRRGVRGKSDFYRIQCSA